MRGCGGNFPHGKCGKMDLSFLHSFSHWQVSALVFLFLAQGAIFSPVPEEITLMTLGLFCRAGRVSAFEALLAGGGGVLLANFLLVLIGRHLIGTILRSRWGQRLVNPARVERAREVLDREGLRAIFLVRFIPIVRAPIYLAAGLSSLSHGAIFRSDFLAACFQIPAMIGLGYALSVGAESAAGFYLKASMLELGFCGVAWIVVRWVRSNRQSPSVDGR